MTRPLARALRACAATAAVVSASIAGTAIVGAVGTPSPVVHGCYGADHVLRIFDPGTGCPAAMTTLDWPRGGVAGARGADGQPGPRGPQGDRGETGPAGADGRPLGFETATKTVRGRGTQVAEARCPDGELVVAGSFDTDAPGRVSVLESVPTADFRGWDVAARPADPGQTWSLTATARCLRTADQAPRFAVPGGGSRGAACAPACVPSSVALADASATGIPVLAVTRAAGATITARVSCAACRGTSAPALIGRAMRRNTAKGPVKLDVRLTRDGARRLAARRDARLVVSIAIAPRRGKAARVVRRLTIRG